MIRTARGRVLYALVARVLTRVVDESPPRGYGVTYGENYGE